LYVHYPDDDEYEEIVASELIMDHHIATSEWRAFARCMQPTPVPGALA
jgi:hypothetical protein